MRDLNKILTKLNSVCTQINNNMNYEKPEFDSRKVSKNDLFVAIKGTVSDGHSFIPKAIELGAKVIVCEELPENLDKNVNYIQVTSSSEALGIIAADYFDNPSEKLKLIGITGTNGKTTIATSLYNLTKAMGYKVGLISTINILINDKSITATHTTPDQITINKYLNEMAIEGCEYCFIEVSSHSTVQNRIFGLYFSGGIFTNITHDNLDFHKTFKEYIKDKQRFFELLPKDAFALTNIDDKNGNIIVQNTKAKKYTYSLKSISDFKSRILESHFDSTLITINDNELWTSFIGNFNAYNLLAVYACAVLTGLDSQDVLREISILKPVEGRFETIKSTDGISAIVDYAHTPDAVKNVLTTINEILDGAGQLITVVGTGGDRDTTKRPEMASIAVELSNKVILTSDNPRTEDPEKILDDMQTGVRIDQKRKVLIITNRAEAIRTACMMAMPGDVILVAGKGHEKYQEVNGVRHHFDDKEIIEEKFKNK
ncbi:MAG: UDP-N-acetylmuramoyl-L-alanyl-D-glutamate--2,6-diaminopimelate ligase [Marinilabiliales bacterium]|nr:MAG: UDP-N-acetylmuramoyl-L-alanyl-D-glutamate--2,6-diaminopimelate ligase [Marinilabiliales bacterium]